jgi:hypothetical protein
MTIGQKIIPDGAHQPWRRGFYHFHERLTDLPQVEVRPAMIIAPLHQESNTNSTFFRGIVLPTLYLSFRRRLESRKYGHYLYRWIQAFAGMTAVCP